VRTLNLVKRYKELNEDFRLKNGPYDLLITNAIQAELQGRRAFQASLNKDPEALSYYLIDLLSRKLRDSFESLAGEGAEKTTTQIELINDLLRFIQNRDQVPQQVEVLRWLGDSTVEPILPQTGLLHPWLFTAGRGMPSLLNELRAEMGSCDRLDILVSFITMSGLRKIRDILDSITARDAQGQQRSTIRILTTTYMAATEKKALDELAVLPGCEVKISLDGRRTRLHAKAWMFHRHTGFGTAYVGSANLSAAAMTGGLEWTVKFSQREQAALYERACANFETLWEDSEFQTYDPTQDAHQQALLAALKQESGRDFAPLPSLGFLEVSAKPFQLEILDQLAFERQHGRNKNLLVAATGTGKTVMAALDYRRFAREQKGLPRLLFVAHRIQILRQAQRTFQQVLGNSQFGELLGDGHEPQSHEHLFVVINSVNSRKLVEKLGANYWAMVVVDECHHIAAQSFSSFVNSVRPMVLLGLTATPERADGQAITTYFDARPDGSPAAELRLWHALELQLLCPFEYYGCDDETDFSSVNWNSVDEAKQIAALVDGNTMRARAMLREWGRLTDNPATCKALVFCVSIAHANFIAGFLNDHGVKALAVHSQMDRSEAHAAPGKLQNGELAAIVAVDLYNEGVDLPFVDTLILLRPTQSPVVFQQQIGRGLRLFEGKQSCLVLDFVGQHARDFRFDRLLSGITGFGRKQLKEGFEQGFPTLPSGCHLFLQKKTKAQVLAQLQTLIGQRWAILIREVTAFKNLNRDRFSLPGFLNEYNLALSDVFRGGSNSGWLSLLDAAGSLNSPLTAAEERVSTKLSQLIHFDDPVRIDALRALCVEDQAALKAWTRYFYFMMEKRTPDEAAPMQWAEEWLNSERAVDELHAVQQILESHCRLLKRSVPGLEHTTLCLHASYTSTEVALAVGWYTPERQAPVTAGVLSLKEQKLEVFFVTLDKTEGFHESIAYTDCAISQTLFKWQTQNSAGLHTKVGKRYLESATNGWHFQLFVRVKKGEPFKALGPVKLKNAEGCGPMTVMWELVVPMGANIFRQFSVIGGL
jgi:superfamily II DNA or RNA helicase/HKD family nuclease